MTFSRLLCRAPVLGLALALASCDTNEFTPEQKVMNDMGLGPWFGENALRSHSVDYSRSGEYIFKRDDQSRLSAGRYTIRIVKADTFEIRYEPREGARPPTETGYLMDLRTLYLKSAGNAERHLSRLL